MDKRINDLEKIFQKNRDSQQALKMKNYLRDQFEFLGISKPNRSALEKDFIKEVSKEEVQDILKIINILHNKEYREYMYTAQVLGLKVYKRLTLEDIYYLCELTRINPWWENTDGYMAIVKRWLKLNPKYIKEFTKHYQEDSDFWLRRMSIICQLSLKEETNFSVLKETILKNIDYDEFFIQKAIGWALRDYSKSNPKEVQEFINKYNDQLSNLAKREGSKYL